LPFDSEEARLLNSRIAETMYFAALKESHALALKYGPYLSIDNNGGAPIRHGLFQQDLCNIFDKANVKPDPVLNWPWEELRKDVQQDGVRNSLLIALMPTAATSAIMGFQECFEPFFSNAYMRKTKSGETLQLNRYMVRNLIKAGCWSPALLAKIKKNNGSLKGIDAIPLKYQAIHKITQDISLRALTEMARDRSYWVDQSMSLNVYYPRGTDMVTTFVKYLITSHRFGLKTSSYYTRQFVDNSMLQTLQSGNKADEVAATVVVEVPMAVCPMRKPGESTCSSCEG